MELQVQNIIFTPNAEILLKAHNDTRFYNLLQHATYLTIDGIGVFIGLQMIPHPKENESVFGFFFRGMANILLLPYFFFNLFFRRAMLVKKYGERICGSDITKDILKMSEERNIEVVVLDLYSPDYPEKMECQKHFREKVLKAYPNLRFQYHIYAPDKETEILQEIKNSEAKILFSTLGMYKQEESVIHIMKHAPNIRLGL